MHELQARVGAQLDLAAMRRATDRRFRALVDAGSDVVFRTSPDWSELRAIDGREFIADTPCPNRSWLEDYIDAADRPEMLEAIAEAIRTKSVFELAHRVRTLAGDLRWTVSRAVPVLDGHGEIVEWVGATTVPRSTAVPTGAPVARG